MSKMLRVVWLALLAALFIACGTTPQSPAAGNTTTASTAVAAPEATAAPAAKAAPTINRGEGKPDAPVKVIAYSDFQCPYCAAFAREAMPEIEKNYIETGKVYFEFRDFPLSTIHGSAVLAAHVANCAGVQNNYYGMHDRLFAGQDASEWGSDLAKDFATFLGYARELKLDDQALQSCVQSQQFRSQIESDYRSGLEVGVKSTPTFVVNGELLIGAQAYGVWKTTLDAALAKAGK